MALFGIVALLLAGSLIPYPREWCMQVKPACPQTLARQCIAAWTRCEGIRHSKFRENGRTLPGSIEVADLCAARYAQQCQVCGQPGDTGDYWRRLQRNGPWFLSLRPARLFKEDVASPTCPYGVSG